MKILKHGVFGLRHFICETCRCEFVATPTEYYAVFVFESGTTQYRAACPDCARLTYKSKQYEGIIDE